ncbi:hypothetical protein C8Q80DRAFT_1127937 [Daedaleopsis nitida]|nr:hypothetical protein C8Q80DRAFT_1127937 [Daedaleopsis nitida]
MVFAQYYYDPALEFERLLDEHSNNVDAPTPPPPVAHGAAEGGVGRVVQPGAGANVAGAATPSMPEHPKAGAANAAAASAQHTGHVGSISRVFAGRLFKRTPSMGGTGTCAGPQTSNHVVERRAG